MRSLPFKTLLFDVDGTLIDSNGAHAESWTQALREHGVTVEVDHIRRMIGMGGDKILPAVAHVSEESDAGRDIAGRKKQIFSAMLPGLRATHGARPLLEYLSERHIELIIATSADDREMNSILQQAGVDDLIPSRTTKDDAPASKPDPDIVHAALARSWARPEQVLLIGDTPYDVEAADRAGIACDCTSMRWVLARQQSERSAEDLRRPAGAAGTLGRQVSAAGRGPPRRQRADVISIRSRVTLFASRIDSAVHLSTM